MSRNTLKTEAELRNAVIDRLIAAALSEGKPAREANLERWRSMNTKPATNMKLKAKKPVVKI
jgi:hypothetical protein